MGGREDWEGHRWATTFLLWGLGHKLGGRGAGEALERHKVGKNIVACGTKIA